MVNFISSDWRRFLILLSIVAVAIPTSFGYTAHAQSEDAIAQSKDLCGGTTGNGEIASIGSTAFTLKLHDDGQKGGGNLVVNLTPHTTIETSTGYVSITDLKIGDRVTLVGDNHRDGTFAADAVVVCSGTVGASGTDQPDPIAVRNKDSEAYEKVSGMLNTVTVLLFGSVWFGIAAFLLLKKKKGLVYVLFFTIFYIYLYKVLDYTLLQFQSLLLLQHFLPDLMLNGFRDGTNVNFIPLATLTFEDVKTSFLNILIMVPFGFGLPFITDFRFKRVVVTGLLLSISIELLQLVTGFMASTTFRVADINDLLFNVAGVAIGYILFVAFVHIYRCISRNWSIKTLPILRYIAERPQIGKRREQD